MAKPTGGLLAFSARGSIAKTIVFSSWRGRQYVRQHVIPANPRSSFQTQTRNSFSFLMALWKTLPSEITASWTLAAKGLPITDRNLFGKANISNLRSAMDLTALVLNNGAKGGLPPAVLTVTPGATQLVLEIDPPALPTGWSISSAIFAIFENDATVSLPVPVIQVHTDTTPDYAATFTGLVTGDLYNCQAWIAFVKPDGSPAYGTSLYGIGTPT